MRDNAYEPGFGPWTPGNVSLICGQTHGFTPDGTVAPSSCSVTVNDTIVGDSQPAGDICDSRDTSTQLPASTDKNIGELLNENHEPWASFQPGFRETAVKREDRPADGAHLR